MANNMLKFSSTKNITIGLLIILIMNIIVFPYFATETVNYKTILDLCFGFSYDDVIERLSPMQVTGRHRYLLTTLFVDTPYALFYGIVYSLLFTKLIGKEKFKKMMWVVLLPYYISIFDIIENIGVVYFTSQFPAMNVSIVPLFSIANQLKWIMAGVIFIIGLFLLLKKQKLSANT